MAERRPTWTIKLQRWLSDEVLDEESYAKDGADDSLLDEIERAVNKILCRKYGHEIIHDHCGIPDHRYCQWCNVRITELTEEEISGG